MNRDKKIVYGFLSIMGLLSLTPSQLFAQGTETSAISQDAILMGILVLLAFIVIVLIVVIFSLSTMKKALLSQEAERKAAAGVVVEEEPTFWSTLMARLTRSVPVEQEADVMLDHNYDGIRELDNHLPPWWTWLFNITIAFGVVYLLLYHVFQVTPLQTEEYENEIALAEEAKQARQAALAATGEAFDESTIEFTDDPAILASGETIFVRQCAACHREDGGGSIGPNLTDNYWLHGGSVAEIYNTVKVGVPDKGMISWEAVLSPEQMRDVSVYIVTLVGTNPENPKEPQGDLVESDI